MLADCVSVKVTPEEAKEEAAEIAAEQLSMEEAKQDFYEILCLCFDGYNWLKFRNIEGGVLESLDLTKYEPKSRSVSDTLFAELVKVSWIKRFLLSGGGAATFLRKYKDFAVLSSLMAAAIKLELKSRENNDNAVNGSEI